MSIHRCTSRRPAALSAIVLIVALVSGQQARAQLSLLDPLTSTTQQLLSPLDPLLGSVTGLVAKLSGDLQALLGGAPDQPVAVIVQTYNPPRLERAHSPAAPGRAAQDDVLGHP